jgi:hypothetical protein
MNVSSGVLKHRRGWGRASQTGGKKGIETKAEVAQSFTKFAGGGPRGAMLAFHHGDKIEKIN